MSVRAYHLRREVYRKRSGPVSNPGMERPRSKQRRLVKRLAQRLTDIQTQTILKGQTNG